MGDDQGPAVVGQFVEDLGQDWLEDGVLCGVFESELQVWDDEL